MKGLNNNDVQFTIECASQDKCFLNGGVPLIEVTHTTWRFYYIGTSSEWRWPCDWCSIGAGLTVFWFCVSQPATKQKKLWTRHSLIPEFRTNEQHRITNDLKVNEYPDVLLKKCLQSKNRVKQTLERPQGSLFSPMLDVHQIKWVECSQTSTFGLLTHRNFTTTATWDKIG